MEFLDMSGEAAELGREPREQGHPKLAVGIDQLLEGLAAHDEERRRIERDGSRRMGCTVEEGQFSEEVAATERRDDRLFVAFRARQDDLDRAGFDDEERVARVALVEDRLALLETADPK